MIPQSTEQQNWQVQTLDGVCMSDHSTQEEAQAERERLSKDYQEYFRVRRTA